LTKKIPKKKQDTVSILHVQRETGLLKAVLHTFFSSRRCAEAARGIFEARYREGKIEADVEVIGKLRKFA
jgi:hypothetical protein